MMKKQRIDAKYEFDLPTRAKEAGQSMAYKYSTHNITKIRNERRFTNYQRMALPVKESYGLATQDFVGKAACDHDVL